MLLRSTSSIRSVSSIYQHLGRPASQSKGFYISKTSPWRHTPKRSYSSFNYEKPEPPKEGPSLIQGATILIGGIFIGWKTRVSYVKHKYGDPSLNVSLEDEEEDGYTGIDWTENPVYAVLDLEAADKKMTASQKSFEFVPKAPNDMTRLDTIRFGSNVPVEDQLAHESVDIGVAESRNLNFWGVYDGHAGWACAKVLKQSLIAWVARALKESQIESDIPNAITSAFVDLDKAISTNATDALSSNLTPAEIVSRLAPASSGSCALLGVHDPTTSTLYIANTGDSRAVLGRRNRSDANISEEWTALALSEDQTGFNPKEIERMAKDHPGEKSVIDPSTGRVLGIMISRAFGDVRWKWPLELINDAKQRFWDKNPRPDYKSPPYLTAEPVITTTSVQPGDFLILASDGLWDHMSSEDAVKAVGLWVMGQRNPQAMRILTSLSSIGDANKKDSKPSVPDDWKATEEFFTVSEGDNAAAHLVRQSLGGNRKELFCSVVGLRAPASRNVRDDITVQVVFFGDVIGGK